MVTVRPATRSDLLDMEALISRSVEMGDVLPRTLQELTDLLPSFFVAETEDGRIVGTAALEIYNQKLAEVRSLCTSPEARGEGIGRALVAACLDLAREKGVLEVMAITDKEAFFRACGFDYSLPNQRRALFFLTGE
jgi:N-acetylglutamate synthase-like GNAT family acetyltransferase